MLQLLSGFYFGKLLAQSAYAVLHFNEHQQQTLQLDIIAFLKLHYSNPAHQQSEPDKHQHLPFHQHISMSSAVFLHIYELPQLEIALSDAQFTAFPRFFNPSDKTGRVFQPPRF